MKRGIQQKPPVSDGRGFFYPIPPRFQPIQFHWPPDRLPIPDYWAWGEQVESYGTLTRQLRTSLGWRIQYPHWNKLNLRSMRNWPVQSTGADMLRMTMIALEDAGIEVIAPIHDAVLVQAPTEEINETVEETKDIMRRVSAI